MYLFILFIYGKNTLVYNQQNESYYVTSDARGQTNHSVSVFWAPLLLFYFYYCLILGKNIQNYCKRVFRLLLITGRAKCINAAIYSKQIKRHRCL